MGDEATWTRPVCGRRTVLHPVCPSHAAALFSVAVRRARHGCGLFATRTLRRGDVLLPYTGQPFRDDADRRRHQNDVAHSPYAFQARRLYVDAPAVRPSRWC